MVDLLDATWMRGQPKSSASWWSDEPRKRKLGAVELSDEASTDNDDDDDDSQSSKRRKQNFSIAESKPTDMPELVNWAKRVHNDSVKMKNKSTQLVKDFDTRAKSFIEFVGKWTVKQGETETAFTEAQTELTQSFQVPILNVPYHTKLTL